MEILAEHTVAQVEADQRLGGGPLVNVAYVPRPRAEEHAPSSRDYYPILKPSGLSTSRTSWLGLTIGVHTGAVSFQDMPYSLQQSIDKTKLRFELRDTVMDRRPNDPEYKRRAEVFWSTLVGNASLRYGTEYWTAMQFKFATPTDPVGLGSRNIVIDQIPDQDLPGSPILSTRFVGGNLRIVTRAASDKNFGTVRYDQPILTDVVHDLVRRVVLGESGKIDVWLDGIQIVGLTDIPIGQSGGSLPLVPKMGLYAPSGVSGIVSCEFANYAFWGTVSLQSRISSPPDWPKD
ncbi:heparin lyase I family protein [Agrobacterium sp. RAC06]|uniref:heparin lyase I family protein n=1 Tax=Agrobacterium sp. RAC06 TaxID=1842536 RepID=UPI0008561D14|nr:heparin lyase I family protein [Agrobacterium sp. RAC06]AOG12727.1 polysaccharide lyase family protein [Agrobacterium sp. RAC06]